jgi:hypothetical protein
MDNKKRYILLIVFLMTALLAAVIPVTKAVAGEATSFSLINVHYSFANGFVFIFSTDGRVAGHNLSSTVNINGNAVELDCVVKNDERLVVCHTTKDLGTKPGDTGVVTINGRTFYFSAPKVTHEPVTAVIATCPTGQMAIYHLNATCSHGINVGYDFSVPSGVSMNDFLQQILDLWAFFGDPLTVNSVTFVRCQP